MSDISAFENIWNNIISKSIEFCKAELDDNFKKYANVETVNLTEYKIQLEQIYKRKLQWLKKNYLPNEKNPTLDFHKLSSVMCRSMIGVKLFTYDISKSEKIFIEISSNKSLNQFDKIQWQINNVYINYKLAFLVAEGIVFVDLLYWTQNKIDSIKNKYDKDSIENNVNKSMTKLEIYKNLINVLNIKHNRLCNYKPSSSHDDFITSGIIALMKNDYLNRDFDYLQFSLSMFQWQEYTKKQYLSYLITEKSVDLTLSEIV